MTDLSAIYEEFMKSDVMLTQEYWDKQNKQMQKMQEDFDLKRRRMIPTWEQMNRPFDI